MKISISWSAVFIVILLITVAGLSYNLVSATKPPAIPAARVPAGHLMMVLTDGKDFYVADGAGINVFDPNVVHRLTVAEPNAVEPNTP